MSGLDLFGEEIVVRGIAVIIEPKARRRECTGRLGLSEPATCRRIDAARASQVFPVILERLAEGTITLAAIGMLIRHLTPENHVAALRRIPT